MEKMLCSCCGAAIIPTITQAFLTCEYCDTSVPNPHYDQAAAAEAAKPTPAKICLSTLLEMGAAQKLSDLDMDCFGNPINGIDAARAGLSIPDSQRVYFLYAHTFLLLGFSDGLALTDDGLYYRCDSGAGSLSWDAFVTGAISCVDRANKQDGTLRIGSAVEIAVKSDKDSRLARFLVDFHNHVYHLCTGETAPASWAVTEPAASAQADDPSLLDALIPAVGALLGTSAARRQTIVRRTPAMHPTSRPTVHQDRRNHIEPPRPLQSQPHHRGNPGGPGRSGGPNRPGGQLRPGNMGGPGGPGRSGGPGRGRR